MGSGSEGGGRIVAVSVIDTAAAPSADVALGIQAAVDRSVLQARAVDPDHQGKAANAEGDAPSEARGEVQDPKGAACARGYEHEASEGRGGPISIRSNPPPGGAGRSAGRSAADPRPIRAIGNFRPIRAIGNFWPIRADGNFWAVE